MPTYSYSKVASGNGYLIRTSDYPERIEIVHIDQPTQDELCHIEETLKVTFTSYNQSTNTAHFK